MKRYIVLGIVGVILLVAAIVMNETLLRDDPAPPQSAMAPPSVQMPPPVPPVVSKPPTTPAPSSGATLQAPPTTPVPVAPSFDIVRVNPRGDAVMAGRAMPQATVTILDGDRPIGKVQADGRGNWVWVPTEPLTPGSRHLSLSAELAGGATIKSEAAVVLVVPERDKDIAGQPAAEPGKPLALMVPREGAGATVVLLAPPPPAPPASASAPSPAAAVPAAPPVSAPAPSVVASVDKSPPPAAPAGARARPAGMALTVDALDYDERGHVSFSGRAEPSGRLAAYIDNNLAGRTQANGRGEWQLTPQNELPVGQYQLRVDLIEEQGKVLARVELIFHRALMIADVDKPGSVVIQPGNNLWRIARHTYGAGIQYTLIFDANRDQIRDPNLIYPGQVFVLPSVN